MTKSAPTLGNTGTQDDGNLSNDLTPLLNSVIDEYRRDFGTGLIDAILLVDEDAKVLAGASQCDMGNSIYDLGILSAALYGIGAEGKDRFKCEDLNTCLLTWRDRQIFIQSIGAVKANGEERSKTGEKDRRRRERMLILSALTDERVNIGLMRIKMREVAREILRSVSSSSLAMQMLSAKEEEIEKMIKSLSSEITSVD